MIASKPPKKSETLEVRLPYDTKTAFMARCRDLGQTASDAVRGFIETELVGGANEPRRVRLRFWQTAAAAFAGLALGAFAAPSLALTTPTERPAFNALDQDHDGVLTPAEFSRR